MKNDPITFEWLRPICSLGCVFLLLCGCASVDDGVRVDLQGEDRTRYAADLEECQRQAVQAEQNSKNVTSDATTGGLIGGAINVAVGGSGAVLAAGTGALSAGAIAGSRAAQQRKQRVRDCLDRRGYNLLD